ncbi:SLC13/DASS family transporter, partial [Klebsiella pneumoniae]|nr:SLC13/DASS family transporter [Klebsiella pneumoniae]
PNNSNSSEVGSIGEQRDYSHVPRWKQILSLVVLIATILGMIFEKQTGISLTVAGCIGALVLVITGVLTEKQAYKAID